MVCEMRRLRFLLAMMFYDCSDENDLEATV